MKPVICIAGPTASGKSAYAVKVAQTVGGEVINADALQVYAELHILSARPTADEMGDIPHHLFGHVRGDQRYSTGQWLRDVERVILDCLGREVVPVLVGGTGLYFRALLEGMADIPNVSEKVQAETEAFLKAEGIAALRAVSEKLDPVATSRVLGDDPQRLQRIVNVAQGTGQTLTYWQGNTRPVVPTCFAKFCVLTPARETLYDRINMRYEDMLRGGGLDEAKRVFDMELSENLPMMKAIGLRQLRNYFNDMTSLDIAVEDAKRESRRFAKRQMTWFRNQPPKGEMLETEEDRDAFLNKIIGVEF